MKIPRFPFSSADFRMYAAGNGRILLPQELRSYAQLAKHLCLVGQGKKLEIWGQEAWAAQRELWLSESASSAELPEKLRSLAL